MNLTYDYFLLSQQNETYPSWIKNEHYNYCENFPKIFSIFKRK